MIKYATMLILASLLIGCASTEIFPAEVASVLTVEDVPAVNEVKEAKRAEVTKDNPEEPLEVELDGVKAFAPSGSKLVLVVESTERVTEAGQKKESEVRATGPGIKTGSDVLAREVELAAPSIADNGIKADAGGLDFVGEALGHGGSGMTILYGLGGICVVAGIAIVVLVKRVGLGVAVSAAGVLLLAVVRLLDVYPWIGFVALAAAGGLGLWLLLEARAAKRKEIALRTVVRAVEKSPDGGEPVKMQVKAEAHSNGKLVKDVITKVKRSEGLTT